MDVALAAGFILALAVIFVIMVVKSLIVICPPNRVAVISGRQRTLSDGRTVGYRILKGGRTLRIPLLEKVSWMDLNTIPLDVSVTNAFSKGAIPLNVQGIANVKVSSTEGLLENAAERFLDFPSAHIGQIAKETLEANLRGVLATLSPEEVNEDRLKFSQVLIDEADDDMKTLGLSLDVLKIQNVTDDVLYLESIGRKLTAEVVRNAKVAEANRKSESQQAEAKARQLAEIAQVQADKAIVEQQNELRVRTAELDALGRAKEEQAKVAGDTARAVAEQELQAERIELEKRRLEANVVTPARADLEARQLNAQASAASIIEDGKAQVEIFRRITDQYQIAGEDGQRIFVLNMLPELIDKIVSVVQDINIERVAVVDSGGSESGAIPGFLSQLPATVAGLTEQIGALTGVDILGAMRPDDGDEGSDDAIDVESRLPPPAPSDPVD